MGHSSAPIAVVDVFADERSNDESQSDGSTATDDEPLPSEEQRRTSNISVSSFSDIPNYYITSDTENGFLLEDSGTPTKSKRTAKSPLLGKRAWLRAVDDEYTPGRSKNGLVARPVRKVHAVSSPRPRTKRRQEERDRLNFPVVLLHVTLLPISLPWGLESMKQVLPDEIFERLNLLRHKCSEGVLQRGILIPHPQDDLDALEDTLLEALELESARHSLCEDDEDDVECFCDDEQEDQYCDQCRRRPDDRNGTERGTKRWDVKIYAANGLMRNKTWLAAWNEMEKVDVEIAPMIPDDMRKKLDALREAEEIHTDALAEQRRLDELESREVQLHEAQEQQYRRDLELEQRLRLEEKVKALQEANESSRRSAVGDSAVAVKPVIVADLQKRPVPLDVLFRNYVYLLLQDKRNIAIVLLGLMLLLGQFGSLIRFGAAVNLQPSGLTVPSSSLRLLSIPGLNVSNGSGDDATYTLVLDTMPIRNSTADLGQDYIASETKEELRDSTAEEGHETGNAASIEEQMDMLHEM